ncbi:hypothetical protein BY996DRAFT_7944688 [Phakopsora pachyrhizi]|nr:hypothetical protein BY996DRAFT_7944688 [Phakopsora pachyrhizi]
MSSSNTTTTNSNSNSNSSGLGAATYYSAIAVVVALLIAIAVTSRILYIRRSRRLAAAPRSIDPEQSNNRENEERLAMERRGEEAGLPTYRQSILSATPNNLLDATPMSSHPFGNLNPNHSVETLPGGASSTLTVPIGPTLDSQPPKYEDSPNPPSSLDLGNPPRNFLNPLQTNLQSDQNLNPHRHPQQQPSPTSQIEMRMMNSSNVTLVLPSIQIQDTEQQPRLHPSRDSSVVQSG